MDLRAVPADVDERLRRSLLIGRLQQLGQMGLAHEATPSVWKIDSRAEQTLRDLGERGDIIRTMQRAFGTERRHFAFFDSAAAAQPVVGRIAAKGLADELQDRGYLIVDGLEGRAHHVPLPARIDLSELPVRIRTPSSRRTSGAWRRSAGAVWSSESQTACGASRTIFRSVAGCSISVTATTWRSS